MDYIKGGSRDQVILFPEAIDDYIDENNPVKFVDAFVESLDLAELGFKYSRLKQTGRPPYNPADILKLYIYGYLNRVRSSRRLEKEAARNVELMWLLKKLVPDHKTIANFRVDNLKALKATAREFTLICKKLDLFGAELIAVDGSKFRAQNSKKRNFTAAKLRRTIKAIDEKIDTYIADLEENDQLEESSQKPSAGELREKIAALKAGKEKHADMLEEMNRSGTNEISLTDSDARLMMNSQRVELCYNTQIAVDDKHKLIVEADVINTSADQGQLSSMCQRAKETLGAGNIEVLADKGYYDSLDIKACLDDGTTPLIPRPARRPPRSGGFFSKARFKYEPDADVFICPAGDKLAFQHARPWRGKTMRLYQTNRCPKCRLKASCTPTASRTVSRWEHEAILEAMEARIEANKDKFRQRQWLVEHPFGTMKRSFDQGYMLLRGLDKVRTEFSLTVLAYNMKRAVKIVGIQGLIAAVRPG